VVDVGALACFANEEVLNQAVLKVNLTGGGPPQDWRYDISPENGMLDEYQNQDNNPVMKVIETELANAGLPQDAWPIVHVGIVRRVARVIGISQPDRKVITLEAAIRREVSKH